MTVFCDSSGVVKMYVPERQHELVRTLTGPIVISAVTRVEVVSAFWRKHRLGEVSGEDAATLAAAFEADLDDDASRFVIVGVGPEVLEAAASAVARHDLRAYDAVQLATAVATRAAVGELDRFVAFDVALRRAAAIEGFDVVPDALVR